MINQDICVNKEFSLYAKCVEWLDMCAIRTRINDVIVFHEVVREMDQKRLTTCAETW